MKKHVLVIGGTGMLKTAVLELAGQNNLVSVVARDKSRLQQLKAQNSNLINPISVHYGETTAFIEAIKQAIEQFGSISTVIVWMHQYYAGTANQSFVELIKLLSNNHTPCHIYHIKADAQREPADWTTPGQEILQSNPQLFYREILLGYIHEEPYNRWLTDPEIHAGVMNALKTDASRTIVGTISPWDDRP